jgi:hypothetical protein
VPATNEKNNNLMILPSPFSQNFWLNLWSDSIYGIRSSTQVLATSKNVDIVIKPYIFTRFKFGIMQLCVSFSSICHFI